MRDKPRKDGKRIVQGMEHMGPVPEEIARGWEEAIAQGWLKPGVPTTGISGYLNRHGNAAAIAIMGLHSLPKKKE